MFSFSNMTFFKELIGIMSLIDFNILNFKDFLQKYKWFTELIIIQLIIVIQNCK